MKTFPSNFFEINNIVCQTDSFLYQDEGDKRPQRHVCYNVNDGFFYIMGASVLSVLDHNQDKAIVCHVFTDGYSDETKAKVEQLARENHFNIYVYTLNMDIFQDFHIKVARFSRITYGRLVMPIVLAGMTGRFVYIDADIMCVNSIEPLYEMDLHGAAMGARCEIPSSVEYRAGYLKLTSGKYFNDGIMVVDVNAWMAQHITEKAFSYQNEPKERFLGQSQDILNLVFDGSNAFIHKKYNEFMDEHGSEPDEVMVHWTGRRKPWQMVVTDYDAQWRVYNERSPWLTITNILPIKKPANYHDFQQWGYDRKSKGDIWGYVQGIFWYSVLRIAYKMGMK